MTPKDTELQRELSVRTGLRLSQLTVQHCLGAHTGHKVRLSHSCPQERAPGRAALRLVYLGPDSTAPVCFTLAHPTNPFFLF